MVSNGESSGTRIALLLLDQLRDRRGVGERGVGLVGVDRADDAEAHRHHQVVVALLVHQPLHARRCRRRRATLVTSKPPVMSPSSITFAAARPVRS